MRKVIHLFVWTSLANFLFSGLSQDNSVSLLSYPRSGNTWLRYCIEELTKRPTTWHDMESLIGRVEFSGNEPLGKTFDLGLDYAKPYVYKHHDIYSLDDSPLILLLRNPKECAWAHCVCYANFLTEAKIYIENIEHFEAFKGDKLLIYYEDLLSDPFSILEKVVLFLSKITKEDCRMRVNNFLREYQRHKQNSIEFYGMHMREVVTASKQNLLYYSKNSTLESRKKFDNELYMANPYLWDKYLSRYKEMD
ncbi:MAG: hypothetical protein SP4CHLAM5_07250 [Chlamydiia bacterium]|nr:hypothetical protein [Chlamydiia bacterium]MCH9618592.1 hypothetical protein [Chlamydiia bacterium]MCH9623869.1 hypothetical protein [Chlamydiia bacterium]